MSFRIPLILLTAVVCTAAEDGPLRELVDQVRDLEAQIALVERNAATAPDRAALWAGASRGLVAAADPYGAYLTAEEVAVHGLGSDPLRVGLGFDWRRDRDRVLVTRVVPRSPAAAAGIHVGCGILAVDGILPEAGIRFAEALGRGGDRKKLKLRLTDGSTPEVEVVRAELADDGLAGVAEAGPGLIHLRIGRFLPAADADADSTATAAAVRAALVGREDLRAVILDLRGCAGGNLQAAVEIAAGWLPAGAPVIEQAGRDPARSRVWSATAARLPDVPIVVLIDGATASSAEVLAHALHRVRRAPLLGTPSLGKWSVQQLFLLPRGDALLLTVAQLKPPGGTVLAGPLQPDVVVAQDPEATWRCWAGSGSDVQLGRAVELATALAIARPR
jgi:carboxyl-terminal processing protease